MAVFTRKTLPEWLSDGGWQMMSDLISGWAPMAVGMTNMVLLVVTLTVLNRKPQRPPSPLHQEESPRIAKAAPPRVDGAACYGGQAVVMEFENAGAKGLFRVLGQIEDAGKYGFSVQHTFHYGFDFTLKTGERGRIELMNAAQRSAWIRSYQTSVQSWDFRWGQILTVRLKVVIQHVSDDAVDDLRASWYEITAEPGAAVLKVTDVTSSRANA